LEAKISKQSKPGMMLQVACDLEQKATPLWRLRLELSNRLSTRFPELEHLIK
jgi:hypothetical protein